MRLSNNRGIVLDLVIFVVNLVLVRVLVIPATATLHGAQEETGAKLAIGLFFAGLVLLQPLGPFLARWSFHQRTTFGMESNAGCLLFYFMPVYLVMMFGLCTAAAVILSGVVKASESVAATFGLAGLAWSVFSVVVVYRYFVAPKKPPRWTFLTTPAAARLGNAAIYVNAVGFQVLWAMTTASGMFRELVTGTPLGTPGSLSDILGRLVALTLAALVLYLPSRIYYLAEDKHPVLTRATMLLANSPLILTLTFAPPFRPH